MKKIVSIIVLFVAIAYGFIKNLEECKFQL